MKTEQFNLLNYYNYFTEIEDAFIRRRGKNLLLSPLDWALIDGWREREVPLHIVLRAIETIFDGYDKQPNQTRAIKSLFYCREEIEAQHAEWLVSQTGKSPEHVEEFEDAHSREEIIEHIERSINTLRQLTDADLKEDFERAAARLEELKDGITDNFELTEKTLYDIEKFLDHALLSNTDIEHLKTVRKETASQLKIYKSAMEPEAYKNTFELMILKRLREDAGVPRLGLFYL